LDFNRPTKTAAIIFPAKLTKVNLKKFIKQCQDESKKRLDESFIMSILETEDTEPGPGYFDPGFDFFEKKSWNNKQTFGKSKRFD